MCLKGKNWLLVGLWVLASASWASEDALETLKQKAQNNKADAYQYALQLRSTMESDPEFDYLYGVLALSQKSYHEAQFALERVVVMQPANMQARLALAKAYMGAGDTVSANKQFEIVKASDPPAYVMRDINSSLRTMSAQTDDGSTFSSFVEMMVGYDNNVNMATDAANVNLLIFGVTPLTSASRQQSSWFSETTLGVDYFKPLDGNNSLDMKGRIADKNNFSAHDFDDQSYRGSASYTHQVGDDYYRGTVTVQNNRISNSDFQEFYGLSGDWLRQLSNGYSYFAGVFVNRLHYPDDELLDVNQYIAHSGVQKQQGDFTHTVGIMLGTERALHMSAGEHNAENFEGIYYDVRYDVNYKHQLHGRIYVQSSDYQGDEPTMGGSRQDVTQNMMAEWTWQLSEPLSWKTEIGYTRDDSDTAYYTFDRTYAQTGFRYSF